MEHPQGKLVRVISGSIFDVAVDLRRSSSSLGQWVGVTLSGHNKAPLDVPPGFAHAFLVTSPETIVKYKCTDVYPPVRERCLAWDDPTVGVAWLLQPGQ